MSCRKILRSALIVNGNPPPCQNQKGMALLITVMTLALLVALTVEFHRKTWQKFLVSNNYRVKGELQAISESGVNIARALLQVDKEIGEADSLLDQWATLEIDHFKGAFAGGELELHVTDLSGKIQINKLAANDSGEGGQNNDISEPLQQALFNLLTSDAFTLKGETEAQRIVDALVDWIDKDDRESEMGAENSYYESLKESYSCRNGSVRYIEELLFVRGITAEIFYGDSQTEGLINYLTVYGDSGKININTAPLAVVKSLLPTASDETISRFDEYRREPLNEENLSDIGWYKKISGWPGDLEFDENLIEVKSSFFHVIASGVFDTSVRKTTVDLERDEDGKTALLRRTVE